MKYEEAIRKIIDENVKLTKPMEAIQFEENLKNAGMDSLSFISVIVEIENCFSITFPDEKLIIQNACTIKQLCEIVKSVEV